MKILAIDTSSKNASVAILEENNTLIVLNNDDEKTHSQKLMPMIDEAFYKSNLSLNHIDCIACCLGPGSFTGIRIGIATAKAFSDSKNIPVVGVSSLEGLAYNLNQEGFICSLLDAGHGNVYIGLFYLMKQDNSDSLQTTIQNLSFLNLENHHSLINFIEETIHPKENHVPKQTPIYFVGDGILAYPDLLKNLNLSNHFNIILASKEQCMSSSISIGKIGYTKYQNKEAGNSSILTPIYLRKSQAELALEEKKKNVVISKMQLADLKQIEHCLSEEFDDFWTASMLKQELENKQNLNSTYFVAKIQDEIVGFAGVVTVIDTMDILNIVVRKSKRRTGIGSCLLKSIFELAKNQNVNAITLEVNANNLPAISLYQKYGFQKLGIRKNYYHGTEDGITIRCHF